MCNCAWVAEMGLCPAEGCLSLAGLGGAALDWANERPRKIWGDFKGVTLFLLFHEIVGRRPYFAGKRENGKVGRNISEPAQSMRTIRTSLTIRQQKNSRMKSFIMFCCDAY